MPLTVPALETSGLWKPTLHLQRNIRGDLCHPEWRWVWRGMRFLVPLWEGGGPPREVLSGIPATVVGTPGWARSQPGEVGDFDGGVNYYYWPDITLSHDRPVTVLCVFLEKGTTPLSYQSPTADARTRSPSNWVVFSQAGGATFRLQLAENANGLVEVDLGAISGNVWYAAAMTTDQQGGTPRGAALRMDTRAIQTATGTQLNVVMGGPGPVIAASSDADPNSTYLNGQVALVAWLNAAWSERQLLQWVNDPFAFLIPARRLWAPGFVPPTGGVPVSASASPPWEAVARVSPTSRVGPWEAVARVAPVGRSAPWESLARVAPQSAVSPWEAVTRATAATTGPWEGLGRASTARAVPWEGLGRIVRPGSVAWESIQPVSRSLTSAWEGLSRVVKTAVGAWESGGFVGVLRSVPWEAAGQAILRRLRALLWVGE
jgi:hypothetical protein